MAFKLWNIFSQTTKLTAFFNIISIDYLVAPSKRKNSTLSLIGILLRVLQLITKLMSQTHQLPHFWKINLQLKGITSLQRLYFFSVFSLTIVRHFEEAISTAMLKRTAY